jgi:hypothetical protein
MQHNRQDTASAGLYKSVGPSLNSTMRLADLLTADGFDFITAADNIRSQPILTLVDSTICVGARITVTIIQDNENEFSALRYDNVFREMLYDAQRAVLYGVVAPPRSMGNDI